jgi:antitoxin MazE
MEAMVEKWGNSLGVKIPALIVRDLSLKDGSFVDINDMGNGMIMRQKEKDTLREMLNQINEKNIHGEVETGGPIGNEVW